MTKRILVVDDDQALMEITVDHLELAGYQVLKAFDGRAGFEMVQQQKPDLVLLDVRMPFMDGFQVCRLIKFDDELKSIPVIMLTARGSTQDHATGKLVGAEDYVIKPYAREELIQKIKQLLDPTGTK